MNKPLIGIDLGTTNSLVAVFEKKGARLLEDHSGSVLTPSVVSLDGANLLVGQPAKDRLASHPENTVAIFKRMMGTTQKHKLGKKSYNAVDLSALILRHLKEVAETSIGSDVSDVVISVPAYFNQVQRQATKDAAKIAGLNPLRLINEPTAAALAYGMLDKEAESQFLIVDLGGGTFDVTLLNMFDGVMEVTASSGDAFLGGEDFSEALAKWITEQLNVEWSNLNTKNQNQIRLRADAAKTHLSVNTSYEITVDLPQGMQTLILTRDDFEVACKSLLRRMIRPIERCLYDSGTDANEIDQVILVGGATRMPMIKELVIRHLKKFPEHIIDPDHAVALGAAVQAGLVANDQALEDVVMTDVSPFSVGIEIGTNVNGGERINGIFSPIIERNTPLPASREAQYYSAADNQTKLSVEIYQGEAAMVSGNVALGNFAVSIPRGPVGQEGMTVRVTYDSSGLIEVEAKSNSTGRGGSILIDQNIGSMSKSEIEARVKTLQKLKSHPKEDEENIALMAHLNRLYSMATGDDRSFIQDKIIQFESVLSKQEPKAIEQTRGELKETLQRIDDFYVN